ncbi:MAG TPA: AMP-binding protein [Acidimicrobiia bacterium]|nr:AMP-binding protein [Acidimicrobiia bacterium]
MSDLLTFSDAVAAHARLQPHKLAVRDSSRDLTFATWHERANRLANALLDLGLTRGDRVAVLAYNCAEWMEIYVALARSGLVAVPVNFRLTSTEIAYIAGHCEARAVIAQHDLADRFDPIRSDIRVSGDAYIEFGGGDPLKGWRSYEGLIAGAPAGRPAVDVDVADPCALMYTSGTTGRPKGAIRSHAGNALLALASALELQFGRDDIALLVMPLCHANSLYFAHTFANLGATCVIDDRRSFDPEAVLATMARERITFTSLVPTHYVMILALPEATKADYDVSAVKRLLISSAPARRETKLAILEQFPNAGLYELYGSTEAGYVTVLHPEEQLAKLGSVGREWVGTWPIRLLDADGNEVDDSEVGELFSRTPFVFDGYWKDPAKTAECFRGRWCSVGDMAFRDADGYIHLVDRKTNLIISGGENVYPSEVEAVVAAHPGVKDVAVIGVPDDKWGEAVHAVVILHDDQRVSESEIIDWCRTRVAGYKRPRSVAFIEEADMPRTATGKIQHRVLRQRHAETRFGSL